MPTIATVSLVNAELKKLGKEERLRKGRGYYYFHGGASYGWHTSSVYVNTVTSFTVEGWIAEYHRLAAENA
jgi:hypothetical protein